MLLELLAESEIFYVRLSEDNKILIFKDGSTFDYSRKLNKQDLFLLIEELTVIYSDMEFQ